MAIKHGFQHKLYRNSATFATPTWVAVTNCRDLTMPQAMTKSDASIRAASSKMYAPGMLEWGLDWQMIYDPADTNLTALRTAFYARTNVDLMDLDGADTANGSLGARAVCGLFSFEKGEPIDGLATVDISAAPVFDLTNPGVYLSTGDGSGDPTHAAVG